MSFCYSEREIQWKLRECLNLWIWSMRVDKAVNWTFAYLKKQIKKLNKLKN